MLSAFASSLHLPVPVPPHAWLLVREGDVQTDLRESFQSSMFSKSAGCQTPNFKLGYEPLSHNKDLKKDGWESIKIANQNHKETDN
jgi:hypothetical protein